MNVWKWILVGYVVIDGLATVACVGKRIHITPAAAVLTVITHVGLVFAAVLA